MIQIRYNLIIYIIQKQCTQNTYVSVMNSPHSVSKMCSNIKSNLFCCIIDILCVSCCMTAGNFNSMSVQATNYIVSIWQLWCNSHDLHFAPCFFNQAFCFLYIGRWPGCTYRIFTASCPKRSLTVNPIDYCTFIILIHYRCNCFKRIFLCCRKNTCYPDGC